MCSVFPARIWMAWGNTSITASNDSTAPVGLPGRFSTTDAAHIPQTPRLSTANGVFFSPSRRMRSEMPSSMRPQTVRVASGVTSRVEIPVPPVVTTSRALRESSTIAFMIAACSSGTMRVSMTAKWCCWSALTTAGPDRSLRSPRAHESLTVRTEARNASGIEEDVIFLLCLSTLVALLLIEQAQAFHEEALGVQSGGLLLGLALKIDLEVPASPLQHFEYGSITVERTVGRVRNLAFAEVHLALITILGQREQAALAAHLEGLHQVNDVHL